MDGLVLAYQPKVDPSNGRLAGVEALARWRDGDRLLAPDAFLESIEARGDRAAFTDAVLAAALRQVAAWKADHGLIPVAVNVFPDNLEESDLADRVLRAAVKARVPVAALTLEITETAVIADDARAAATISTLVAAGARVSLDDFGTGHSSLVRLAAYPFAEVKIDRHFVAAMLQSERPLLAALFQMGRTLGVQLVAEGVEDRATANALQAVGCETIQGYYIAKPMLADEFDTWLAHTERDDSGVEVVRRALARVRRQLGMETAFISEFQDGFQVHQVTDGGAEVGHRVALCDSYCEKVVQRVFPNVIPDAQHDPLTRDLPATQEEGVGAYVGVPLHRADGEVWGTLCCISKMAQPRLGRSDYALLRSVADELEPWLAEGNYAVSRRGDSYEMTVPDDADR
jgi:EAL domain-containing protein (putative c-di-GMP-specific phosphodiesterase class I)